MEQNSNLPKFCICINVKGQNYYYGTNTLPHLKVQEIMNEINAKPIEVTEQNINQLGSDLVIRERFLNYGFSLNDIPSRTDIDYNYPLNFKMAPFNPPFISKTVYIGSGYCWHYEGCPHLHYPIPIQWHEAINKYKKCYYCQNRSNMSNQFKWMCLLFIGMTIIISLISLIG